jgi:hypothetical protein
MGSFLIEPKSALPTDPNFDFGVSRFHSVRELTVGAGNQVAKTDKIGSFWGNAKRTNASALINNDGSAVFKNIQVSGLQPGSSVNGAYLQALSVLAGAIADNAVTETKISSDAVTSPKIAANAIVAAKIAANAIQASHIAAGQIVASHIGTNTIIANAANIADAVITSAKIASLDAGKITTGELIGRTIKATGGAGVDTWMQNDGYLRFRYGNNNKAYIAADTSGNMVIDSDSTILMKANNAVYFTWNDDGGSDSVAWFNNGAAKMELSDDDNLYLYDGWYS